MKKILSFEYDLTDEYRGIAISSHLKDYKLCWILNQLMKADLAKYSNFKFHKTKNKKQKFSLFYYFNNHTRSSYYLLANRRNNQIMLETYQHFDYLLFLKEIVRDSLLDNIQQELRKTPNILTTSVLDFSKNKKEMNGLFTDLELYEIEINKQQKNIFPSNEN